MALTHLNTVPIENTSDLVRDMNNHAVLNTDVNGLSRYKAQRQRFLTQKKESEETKVRLSTLEQEMTALRAIINDLMHLKGKV